MLKKKPIKNCVVNVSYSCVLFKKYAQYNLWFGNFDEYKNIQYCKKYLQKYVYFWVYRFLLHRFSLYLVTLLYKSPCFIKFIESGFFKYLDYHFLVSFYNSCFTFDLKSKENIKIFVEFYFQKNLKRRLEKDLFFLVIYSLNEIFLNDLIKLLKNIQIYVKSICLNERPPIKLKNKKRIYFLSFFYFKYLIKNRYSNPYFIDFNTLYNIKSFYSFNILNDTYKPLLKFISFKKVCKPNLKACNLSKKEIEKIFIRVPEKSLHFYNKDIQHLVESVECLGRFNNQYKNIGLYKNYNVFFVNILDNKSFFIKKLFKKNKIFKSFNTCFIKYHSKKNLL